jgi:hypothetical protein
MSSFFLTFFGAAGAGFCGPCYQFRLTWQDFFKDFLHLLWTVGGTTSVSSQIF